MNNKKLKNVEFIKRVANIKVKTECDKVNVKRNNFYKLEVSAEKVQLIKDNIDKELKEIYKDYEDTTL